MFPRAFRIARLGGVDVRVDPSWVLIALLVTWTLLTRFRASDDRSAGIALAMAVGGALLFFGSVLAHELAHALEARHRGMRVHGITLFLFGGVTEMQLESRRPRDEFAVAAVGPYVSLVAAAALGLIATGVRQLPGAALDPAAEVAGLIAWLNLLLALFNLLPGAPLDGGRVLRAIMWGVTRDRRRALVIASRAGQGLAMVLIALGVRYVLLEPAMLVNGLWFGFVGWFMFNAATTELRQGQLADLLGGRTVGSLVTVAPPRLPADQPLSFVADRMAASAGYDVFPVVDRNDEVVGVLHVDDVMDMHPHDRGFRTPADVMRPIADVPAIASDAPLELLLQRLPDEPVVKTLQDGQVAALLTERQVVLALQRLHALARRQHRGPHHAPHPLGAGVPGTGPRHDSAGWLPSDDDRDPDTRR